MTVGLISMHSCTEVVINTLVVHIHEGTYTTLLIDEQDLTQEKSKRSGITASLGISMLT